MADSPTKQQVESPLTALVRVRKEAQQAVERFHAQVEAERLAIGKLLSEPTETEAHKPESRPEQRRKDGVALETGAQAADEKVLSKETGVQAKSKKSRPQPAAESPEKITFTRLPDGKTTAEPPYEPRAFLNTYETLSQTLDQVRALITRSKGKVSVRELRKNFGATELGKAADDGDWKNWIEIFAARATAARAKNAALVFLENKTGKPRERIKRILAGARNDRKKRPK